MRIISGIAKGRRLQVPATNEVRPTTDRVREALFSHLGDRVRDGIILDLFAGSGALGLESLSRGAAAVSFIEKSRTVFGCLSQNVSNLGFGQRCSCHLSDAMKWLKEHRHRLPQYDLIFLDPPYATDLLPLALAEIAQFRFLAPDGIIVAEHSASDKEVQLPSPLQLQIVRTKQYGKTAVTTLKWTPPSGEAQSH